MAAITSFGNVTYSDNNVLQSKLLEATLDAKASNPFFAVTLLVDNPLQGTLIRRQLIELAASKSTKAIANFNVMTPIDLVAKLASVFPNVSFREPRTEYLEAVIFFLMNQEQVGDDSEQSMATASAVAKVFRKLQFVSDESVKSLIDNQSSTSTQKYVFGLILAARNHIKLDNAATVCHELIEKITDANQAFLSSQIGTVLNLLAAPANSLVELLEKLNTQTRVINFEQIAHEKREPLSNENAVLISSPDPTLEVSMLARDLMQSLKTVRADRIAVLYPDESEYGNQLRDELDGAGIQWHGKGRTYLQSSAICRGLDLVLEVLSERNNKFSGLDRPRLMRLIENGHLSLPGIGLDFEKTRRWIRRQELFSDCALWVTVLDDVAENDFDPENSIASELKPFLEAFERQFELIGSSRNWEELGKAIWALLELMYANSELIVEGTVEEDSWRRLRALLLGELTQLQPLLSGIGSFNFVNEVMNLRNMVRNKVGDKQVAHGNLSTGVMVGNISSAAFLTFDKVYILGATEGLLPTVTKEDPYLPVHLLEAIDEVQMAKVSKENAVDTLADTLASVVESAPAVVVFRPRGGTKSKIENEPSRFLGQDLNDKKNPSNPRVFQAESREHSFTLDLGSGTLSPISEADYSQLLEKFKPTEHPTFRQSLEVWRNPSANEYFGKLTIASESNPVWSPVHSKPLSSSAIDTFITCRYEFLMTRILKFNSYDRSDYLDDFNPTKFGIYFHKQMENFVNDCIKNGTAPNAGENWAEGSAELFISEYFLKNLYLFINRGQAGWSRSFEFHMRQVVRAIPMFFEEEPSTLRQSPALHIHKPEFSFGYEGDEAALSIVDDENSDTYHIRGAIDRLDVSPDENFAAVMDFKTGKLKTLKAKLQITPGGGLSVNRKTVQDIIYRRVAMARFKKAEDAKVFFVFIPDGGETSFLQAIYAHDPNDFLMKTLRNMKESGISGDFIPTSGGLQGDHAYCNVCKKIAVTLAATGQDTVKGEPQDG
jgi:hypothetical protein